MQVHLSLKTSSNKYDTDNLDTQFTLLKVIKISCSGLKSFNPITVHFLSMYKKSYLFPNQLSKRSFSTPLYNKATQSHPSKLEVSYVNDQKLKGHHHLK